MTLSGLAAKFKSNLSLIYENDEAHSLFLLAIEYKLKLNRSAYLLKKDDKVAESVVIELEKILKELLTGKPIQYILGETLFYGLPFKVNPSVLIPRPETEELVEWILDEVERRANSIGRLDRLSPNPKRLSILDIGTGSGCIAITLKKNLLDATVYALDISTESLETAKQNAALNRVEITFINQDILTIPVIKSKTLYSIIVSNPPYIKEDERSEMHSNIVAFEPHQALFVSNENPLLFYIAIADFALKNLDDNGLLFFEINEYLAKETIQLLTDKGFINIVLRKDINGKDRLICCERSKINS